MGAGGCCCCCSLTPWRCRQVFLFQFHQLYCYAESFRTVLPVTMCSLTDNASSFYLKDMQEKEPATGPNMCTRMLASQGILQKSKPSTVFARVAERKVFTSSHLVIAQIEHGNAKQVTKLDRQLSCSSVKPGKPDRYFHGGPASLCHGKQLLHASACKCVEERP